MNPNLYLNRIYEKSSSSTETWCFHGYLNPGGTSWYFNKFPFNVTYIKWVKHMKALITEFFQGNTAKYVYTNKCERMICFASCFAREPLSEALSLAKTIIGIQL